MRSRDQASLFFNLAEKLDKLSLELSKITRIVPSKKMLISLICNVEHKATSAESGTAHGLSPLLAIFDKFGQLSGPYAVFFQAITTAQGAHDDPLLVALSAQSTSDGDLFLSGLMTRLTRKISGLCRISIPRLRIAKNLKG